MNYTIVYIGATWCATCKTIKPAVERLAKLYNVPLTVLDYDKDMDMEEQETIRKVPTLRIFQEEVQLEEFNESQIAKLEEWLSKTITISTDSADF